MVSFQSQNHLRKHTFVTRGLGEVDTGGFSVCRPADPAHYGWLQTNQEPYFRRQVSLVGDGTGWGGDGDRDGNGIGVQAFKPSTPVPGSELAVITNGLENDYTGLPERMGGVRLVGGAQSSPGLSMWFWLFGAGTLLRMYSVPGCASDLHNLFPEPLTSGVQARVIQCLLGSLGSN
jgi:hypothetical protein